VNYGRRYSKIAQATGIEFQLPESPSSFNIGHRLDGNSTTDFGAPDMDLPDDWEPIESEELERIKKLLIACWQIFDEAVAKAEGKELQKGPRGGGRDTAKIIEHVVEAEAAYLRRIDWKLEGKKGASLDERKVQVRNGVLRGLEAAAVGQLPREGPRGGKIWPPRFFVRRLAWHVVDHAWEIEDRTIE